MGYDVIVMGGKRGPPRKGRTIRWPEELSRELDEWADFHERKFSEIVVRVCDRFLRIPKAAERLFPTHGKPPSRRKEWKIVEREKP